MGNRLSMELGMRREEFEESLRPLGSVADVDDFDNKFGANLKRVVPFTTLRVFRKEILPSWEDEANSAEEAGRWIVSCSSQKAMLASFYVLLHALLDGLLDVNGIVMSRKHGQHMILVWTRSMVNDIRDSVS